MKISLSAMSMQKSDMLFKLTFNTRPVLEL